MSPARPVHSADGCRCRWRSSREPKTGSSRPQQAEAMVEALRRRQIPSLYLLFDGEQHGFRRADNIKRALDAELYFYSTFLTDQRLEFRVLAADQFVEGCGESGEVGFGRQAVVAVLDQGDGDIAAASAARPGGRSSATVPKRSRMPCSSRTGQSSAIARASRDAAGLLEQAETIGVAGRIVLGRQASLNRSAINSLRCASSSRGHNKSSVTSGAGSDTDQRMDALRPGERRQQHDPAAHARPDQDLRPFGQLVENGDCVLGPAADVPSAKSPLDAPWPK